MVVSNPREPLLWTPRTQEMTGGFNPREVLDHDINPNEDADGLSHHSRQTPEDGQSADQRDPRLRRERALRELEAKIPHVSLKPAKIDESLNRSPVMEQEQQMLESGMIDMNRGGLGISAGANVGSVRSEGPNVKFGTQNSVVPFMLGKSIFDNYVRCDECGRKMDIDPTTRFGERQGKKTCMICAAKKRGETTVAMRPGQEEYARRMQDAQPFDEIWQSKNTSEDDPFEATLDSLLKARRKYKGRRYTEDEESDEDERKGKAKNRRKKKRGKKGVKSARGGRQPKSATKRRSAAVSLQLDRESRNQAFHPNVHSHALRNVGATRSEGIPLRLRDPVAWERKKAHERMRRAQGSLPTGLTQHADTRGIGKLGGTIGGTKGRGTRLPTVSRMGTKMPKFSREAAGDPLGAHDPLLAKSKSGGVRSLNRSEIMNMKRKVEALLRRLEKLTKATPELDNAAKVGSTVNGDEASSPEGATTSKIRGEPPVRFIDIAAAGEIGLTNNR